jgi:hypothetical protein
MRFYSILFLLITISSCGSKKNTNLEADTQETAVENNENGSIAVEVMYVGTVEIDENCGSVIRVTTDNDQVSFAPSNFDERYSKEGMRVRFGTIDDIAKAKKCGKHFIITLTRITPLRQ